MPATTQSHPKKRRRDGDDCSEEVHHELAHGYYAHQPHQQHHTASPRKIIPYSSPLSKKIRINTPCDDPYSYQPKQSPQIHSRTPPKPTINLNPCHICHRRPTKKTDLDSYADCEGCGERTCFVCIRQCLGACRRTPMYESHESHEDLMRDDLDDHTECDEDEQRRTSSHERSFSMEDAPSAEENMKASRDRTKGGGTWGRGGGRGHRGRICSQCCVELGSQGEVRCLGCLET